MKKGMFFAAAAFLMTSNPVFAAGSGDELIKGLNNDVVLIIAFTVVISLLLLLLFALYLTLYMVLSQNIKEDQVAEEDKEKSAFLQWFWGNFNAAKPVAKEKEIMLSHNYDGIRELDNDLPPWWKYMFYATIIWSVFYMYYYHKGGTGTIDEYKAEVAQAEVIKAAYMEKMASSINEENVTVLSDAGALSAGKTLFLENCKTCHGENGQGLSGPNLTDDFWIHGCDIKSIYKTVKYGVQAKGMLAWQSKLTPKQMQDVSSYIVSLRGTNPEGAKEAQGDECKPQ